MRRTSPVAALLVIPLLLATSLETRAQTEPGRISIHGRVLDPMRMPVPGARVAVTPANQGSGRSTLTDRQGEFALAVDQGRYTITVFAAGFVEISQPDNVVQAGTESREFVLQIAGVHETVTVSAPTGYRVPGISSATKTPTPLRDIPQSITIITKELIKDQLMTSIGDVVRYIPGITSHQGENNRDQIIIRGNGSTADFFLNGVRDDAQYYRDIYNLDRIEALKGPNAMIFGRGGAGGVVNRVTKEPGFQRFHQISVQGGMYGNKRITADLDEPANQKIAIRVNGMLEDSGSFRKGVDLERQGITPTLTIAPSVRTKITLRYEFLHDTRVADRGITSFQGRPADVDIATFYGNSSDSHVKARVSIGSATVEHRFAAGGATLRNNTIVDDYDRVYQNYVPGAATADMRQVSLTSYNNDNARRNFFNQTDLTYSLSTGRIRHVLLAGGEVGRQISDNFRNTGFFNNRDSSILVPFGSPVTATPVTFRQGATDADNHVRAGIAAMYAQDQIELSRRIQLVSGVRFEHFDLRYHNNRTGETFARPDNLVSPRAGLVFKPLLPLSIYGSYSVSYLPSSGDQFSSLTAITQQLKPEKFNNYEAGAKWDLLTGLSLTTAVYRLDRRNTRANDPTDPTRIVQTGSSRTNGYELGMNGSITPAWSIAGGYAYQDAFFTTSTTSARAGAQVGQVPHHTVSLWNSYQVHPRVRAALGILHRSDMFATFNDLVTLPGYLRADAAGYVSLSRQLRLQANVENILDRKYYVNADGNFNISPGFPRTLRIAVTTTF